MEMFFYGFMQRAFQASLLIAVIAPILGLFLILRRQSLMADTLSHVSLVGIALGFLLNFNPTIMTLLVVIVVAVILEYLRLEFKSYSEVSLAILMSGGLALALVLMSLVDGGTNISIDQFLFGSIVTISSQQVLILAVLCLLTVVMYLVFRKPMYVLTFDEDTAYTTGLPVRLMSVCFNVLVGVAISVIMPIAGSLLVSAILILPAAIAMRLSKHFNTVILVGMVIGVIGMLSGLSVSYYAGTPAGATIALVFIALFILTSAGKKLMTLARASK
ncbi:metal ABC transporter permease [Desemzia incerta]|uniref:metal ABC transporter permease n=1 Tax=Desemzia incerta TaxID=82801 RepID=UPI0016601F76